MVRPILPGSYSAFQCKALRSTPSLAISYSGDISRKRCTTSTTFGPTKPTSSSELNRWSAKRIDECASSVSTPRAEITYDGSSVAEVHADPEESATSLLSPIRTDSPSTYANEMFKLCGSRCDGSPLTKASSTF